MSQITFQIPMQSLPVPLRTVAPKSPDELYQTGDALIVLLNQGLQKDSSLADPMKEASKAVKSTFKDQLVAASSLPKLAEGCHQAALDALSAGLLAGAMDGLIALASKPAQPDPSNPPPAPVAASKLSKNDVQEDLNKLLEKLEQELEAGKEGLKHAGKATLQETSHLDKQVGQQAVDHAGFFADHPKTPVFLYRSFLTSAFATGYALGVTDAAIISVAGDVPPAK